MTIAQDEELTCAKGSGKLGDTTYVVRGCLPKVLISAVDSTLLGSCNSNNLKQWAEKFNLTIDLNPDEAAKVSVDLCFCDGNGCNSALVGSRPSNWLYIFALISAVLLAFNVKVWGCVQFKLMNYWAVINKIAKKIIIMLLPLFLWTVLEFKKIEIESRPRTLAHVWNVIIIYFWSGFPHACMHAL